MAEITVTVTKTLQDSPYEPYSVHSTLTDTVKEGESRQEKARQLMEEADDTTITQISEHIKQMGDD